MSKITILFAACLLQVAFGQQYIGQNSVFSGNAIVDNDVYISGGYGGFGGLGGININNAGTAIAGAGNLGFGNLGLSSGLGLGLSSGLGLGLASGYGSVNVAAPVGISSATLAPFGGYNIIASSPLAVTTVSPIGPSGLAVASENSILGALDVSGQLPFLSAVAFEGALPTAGSGVATCGCGNGQVAIISEGLAAAPALPIGYPSLPIGIPNLPIGYGSGLGGYYF